jgi:hypothetical protein
VSVRRAVLDPRYPPKPGEKLVCGVCRRCEDHIRGLQVRFLMGQYCGGCGRGLELCYEHEPEIVPRKETKKSSGRR